MQKTAIRCSAKRWLYSDTFLFYFDQSLFWDHSHLCWAGEHASIRKSFTLSCYPQLHLHREISVFSLHVLSFHHPRKREWHILDVCTVISFTLVKLMPLGILMFYLFFLKIWRSILTKLISGWLKLLLVCFKCAALKLCWVPSPSLYDYFRGNVFLVVGGGKQNSYKAE